MSRKQHPGTPCRAPIEPQAPGTDRRCLHLADAGIELVLTTEQQLEPHGLVGNSLVLISLIGRYTIDREGTVTGTAG